ncbi:MFS transporter [Oceanobacillus jeddahense]|uniref:MFS transporter n=1 Tax=Oceanobacillus jeddahense TaxID=1462527 RepID=UPI00059625FD|nr:MFS transporter [Oceanobacillus jeddahense]
MEKSISLFRNRTFILLLIAGIFAVLGFSVFLTTTTWYAVTVMGSAGSLGLILIAATVPRLIMMTFGGVLADKYKKTTIMFVSNLVQGFILLLLFILLLTDNLNLIWLLILSGLFGSLDAFFGPASSSMIPKVVERYQLQKANAYFQGVDQLAFIGGPIIAGLVMEAGSIEMSYLASTILVLLSAVFVFPPLIKEEQDPDTGKATPVQNFKEGFSYLRKSRFLIVGILVLITMNFFVFGALYIAIPIIVELLDGTPINLSIMESAQMIGMLASTMILSFVKINRKGLVSVMGLFGTLITALLFSQVSDLMVLTVIVFFIGFAMSFVYIPFFTAAQEQTDSRLMGRVMSIIFLAMNGFDPLAYAMVSLLNTMGISIQAVMFAFSIVGLIITLFITVKAKDYVRN